MTEPEPKDAESTHRHVTALPGEFGPFHLESRWRVRGERERVWEVLSDVSGWPAWWPGIVRTRLLSGGDRAVTTVQSPLGPRLALTLELVRSRPPRSATFAVAGELRGTGGLTLQDDGATTLATITWCVTTPHRVLGALRPVAEFSHGVVMAAGQRGLRRVCERGAATGTTGKSTARRAYLVAGAALSVAVGVALSSRLRGSRRAPARPGCPGVSDAVR